jgi:hypothetical protein
MKSPGLTRNCTFRSCERASEKSLKISSGCTYQCAGFLARVTSGPFSRESLPYTLLTSAPACLRADKRGVDEVLGEEPRLELAGADDVGDEQVVGAVIAERGDPGRCIVRVAED